MSSVVRRIRRNIRQNKTGTRSTPYYKRGPKRQKRPLSRRFLKLLGRA